MESITTEERASMAHKSPRDACDAALSLAKQGEIIRKISIYAIETGTKIHWNTTVKIQTEIKSES